MQSVAFEHVGDNEPPRRLATLPTRVRRAPIEDDPPLLSREGLFEATGTGRWRRYRFRGKTDKLDVELVVIEGGETYSLWLHFNVEATRDGRFTAGPSSKYRRTWKLAAGRRPVRWDRMTPEVFARQAFEVDIKTVKHDADGQPLDPVNQYSVIARVMGRVAGGPQT